MGELGHNDSGTLLYLYFECLTIQVFEYFISHHLAKAFESVFGVVTCLPGCFSMVRIRTPKGKGYCVPILANPDIVEGTSFPC